MFKKALLAIAQIFYQFPLQKTGLPSCGWLFSIDKKSSPLQAAFFNEAELSYSKVGSNVPPHPIFCSILVFLVITLSWIGKK